MSSADKPDDFPLQAGASLPDLTMGAWKDGRAVEADELAEGNPVASQSIFSVRSGIQDPLVKAEAKADTAGAEAALVEPETLPEGAPLEAMPEPKPRKQKGKPKLAKSKRQLERARRRQMNYLQRRREQKKMRVFYNRIRLVFKLCFAVLWVILLWELVHSSQWVFSPAQYSLENQRLLQPVQMEPMVNRWKGTPLYAIDTSKIARDILGHYEILQQVQVRRQLFPPRLDILVQEKTPWAELYVDEKQAKPYGLAVREGLISLAQYQYKPITYHRLPMERLLMAPKTQFKLSYLNRLRDVVWQAHQIKGLRLQSVDVRDPSQVVLNFQEVPVILGKLNRTTSARMARLIPLLPKIAEFRDGIESVDLRWDEQVTFHQKPNTQIKLPQKLEQTQG